MAELTIGYVLGANGIQELAGNGDTHRSDVVEKLSGGLQAVVDSKRAIDIRVIDEPFPSNRRTRLFEISAHEDQEARKASCENAAQYRIQRPVRRKEPTSIHLCFE